MLTARLIDDEETKKRFLREYGALRAARTRSSAPNPAAIEISRRRGVLPQGRGALSKIAPPSGQVSPEAEQAVRQFFSEGLAAGEVIDVFDSPARSGPRSRSSPTSSSTRGRPGGRLEPGVGVAEEAPERRDPCPQPLEPDAGEALRRQLRRAPDALRGDASSKRRGDRAACRACEEDAGARRRHEALGLTVEEAAFYDALVDDTESWAADPKLAEIARALVSAIEDDLTVDWADHEATEAAIRAKIKRLLRRYGFRAEPAGGAGRLERTTDLVLEQARTMYRNWPHVAFSGVDMLI